MVRTKPHNPRLQRGHPLARGLKGFFPFSEHGGDSSQDFALGNTATPLQTNPPSWLATEYGPAITPAFGAAFGVDPFQDPGSDEIEAFTVSTIARNPHVPGNTRDSLLFGFDQNYLLVWDSVNPGFEGKWIIYNGATYTTVSLGTLAANTWYHFVCMHTAGDTRVYVDGVLVSSSASITGANNDAATKIEIGDRLAGNWEFEGDIVHCGFWDRMLSSSEVADHYIDPFALIRPRRRELGKAPVPVSSPKTATGGVSVPVFTVAGVGSVGAKTSTGGVNVPVFGIAGVGSVGAKTSTGGVSVPVFTVAGVGAVGAKTSTGGVAVPVFTVAGVGAVGAKTATGGVTVPVFTIAGVGVLTGARTATGGVAIPVFTVAGVGTVGAVGAKTATGGVAVPAFTIAGVGVVGAKTATGGVTVPVFTIEGYGVTLEVCLERNFLVGVRPMRVTDTERNNIASPTTGLLVYSTTQNAMQFYNGSAWRQLDHSVAP